MGREAFQPVSYPFAVEVPDWLHEKEGCALIERNRELYVELRS